MKRQVIWRRKFVIKNHKISGFIFSQTCFPSPEIHAEFDSGALTRTAVYRIIPIQPIHTFNDMAESHK